MAPVLPHKTRQDGLEHGPTRPPTGFGEAIKLASPAGHRASPPWPPVLPITVQQAEAERTEFLQARGVLERRSILRGLILLAVLVLVISLLHVGFGRAFPGGLWRW